MALKYLLPYIEDTVQYSTMTVIPNGLSIGGDDVRKCNLPEVIISPTLDWRVASLISDLPVVNIAHI